MLSAFWNGFVIILTIGSVLGCWWLLQWTKGISNREGDEIGTTGHVGHQRGIPRQHHGLANRAVFFQPGFDL